MFRFVYMQKVQSRLDPPTTQSVIELTLCANTP